MKRNVKVDCCYFCIISQNRKKKLEKKTHPWYIIGRVKQKPNTIKGERMKSIETAIYYFLLEMIKKFKPGYTMEDLDELRKASKRLAKALEL